MTDEPRKAWEGGREGREGEREKEGGQKKYERIER